MKTLNMIGLDGQQASALAGKLNRLLAAYQVFYMNVRGLHWNIKGEKFFELHLKFEELYTNLALKSDELAERILALGSQPLHSYSRYLEESSIAETTGVSDGKTGMQIILESIRQLAVMQREILRLSADAGDEGTNALMSDYLREQEKMSWMYAAYLQN